MIDTLFDDVECAVCGCTEDHACMGGCSWVCEDPPVCSACVEGTHLDEVLVRIAICDMLAEAA